MKAIIVSTIVAVVASVATTWVLNNSEQEAAPPLAPEINYQAIIDQLDVQEISLGMEPEAAAWIRLNAGAASEQKILANAANSACFLTHVETRGIQGPEDHNSCSITLDDFTGYWQVNATTGEGTQSELYCNARCIVWE